MTDSLEVLQAMPSGLLDLPAAALGASLRGPTLIEIQGRREPPLFVSSLVHGDEVGGWEAVRGLLRALGRRAPARSLRLLIGNPRAAAQGARHLDDQPDFNRVWHRALGEAPDHPLAAAAREVTRRMKREGCFAAVDIHNNSGVNPPHVCVAGIDWYTLRVASLFSSITVHVDHPQTIQTAAFAEFCPAVTLEVGRARERAGVERALTLLRTLLAMDSLDEISVGDGSGVKLFRALARVEIARGCRFAFAGEDAENGADLTLRAELEAHNFERVGQGTPLGWLGETTREPPLFVTARRGELDFDAFFEVRQRAVHLSRDVFFSMFTTNHASIRQDCLCYLMEPIELQRIEDMERHAERI